MLHHSWNSWLYRTWSDLRKSIMKLFYFIQSENSCFPTAKLPSVSVQIQMQPAKDTRMFCCIWSHFAACMLFLAVLTNNPLQWIWYVTSTEQLKEPRQTTARWQMTEATLTDDSAFKCKCYVCFCDSRKLKVPYCIKWDFPVFFHHNYFYFMNTAIFSKTSTYSRYSETLRSQRVITNSMSLWCHYLAYQSRGALKTQELNQSISYRGWIEVPQQWTVKKLSYASEPS